MYIVSVLRSADPSRCSRGCVEEILEQHRRVADEACRAVGGGGGIGAKQYLARQPSQAHWRDHFGSSWGRFAARKARYDPVRVLGPGQGIFPATDSAASMWR
jgi:cytokinin dehydrogenase